MVEDSEFVRNVAVRELRNLRYKVFAAENADSAMLQFRKHKDDIGLVITDVVMGSINGFEFAKNLCQIRPGLKIIFMSGYTEGEINKHKIWKGEVNFIRKPLDVFDFADFVRRVFRCK